MDILKKQNKRLKVINTVLLIYVLISIIIMIYNNFIK
jgi:hypothetical protein